MALLRSGGRDSSWIYAPRRGSVVSNVRQGRTPPQIVPLAAHSLPIGEADRAPGGLGSPRDARQFGAVPEGRWARFTPTQFCPYQWCAVAYGWRALDDLLERRARQGHTLQSMVFLHAPPVENDTSHYVVQIASRLGVPADIALAALIE